MRIEFTLPVEAKTKKNHPQIVWKKQPFQIRIGKFVVATIPYTPFIIPSKGYSEFEKEVIPFFEQVKAETGTVNFVVNMQVVFYMKTKRLCDLTNLLAAVDDAAVKAGFIADDNRDIIAGHDGSRVFYDKLNPRIEITITEMADYTQWKPTNIEQQNLFN
jgi:Holliday junction resolvase RusA-like endonuclease